MERTLPWKPEDPTYSSLDGPPSFKPAKKYSDLSGLPASYTDPHTKIRYANTDEFSRIRMLPSDIVTGYLALRRANTPVP
ncbi:INO80 complex subunit C-like [Branchiostoma floridae]|uniref:INO80 complex subunit C-like n=1 Tax=Branchiostoma floridae TaxID=7739 RepID=A0A9J7HU45_BRAFL|nr:INO80 complex subunit C-like [Branchiostoma floridae]